MKDLLILFVERWFIQITVEEYYYRLYIVSQGLYHAIVSKLRDNDLFIQRYQYHQHHSVFLDFLQEDQFNLDEMLFQHMHMDIGFNFDQEEDDQDENEDENEDEDHNYSYDDFDFDDNDNE